MTWSLAAPSPWGQVPYNQTYGGNTLPFTSDGDQIWNSLQKAGVGLSMPQFLQGNQFLGNSAPRYAFGNALKNSAGNAGTLWEAMGTPVPQGIRVDGSSPGGYPAEYNTGDPYGNFQWMNNMGANSGQPNGQMGMPNQIQSAGNNMQTQQVPQMPQQAPQQQPGSLPMNQGQWVGNPVAPPPGTNPYAGSNNPNGSGVAQLQGPAAISAALNPNAYYAANGGNSAAFNNTLADSNMTRSVANSLSRGYTPQQIFQAFGSNASGGGLSLDQINQIQQQLPGSGYQAPAQTFQPFSGQQRAGRALLGNGNL